MVVLRASIPFSTRPTRRLQLPAVLSCFGPLSPYTSYALYSMTNKLLLLPFTWPVRLPVMPLHRQCLQGEFGLVWRSKTQWRPARLVCACTGRHARKRDGSVERQWDGALVGCRTITPSFGYKRLGRILRKTRGWGTRYSPYFVTITRANCLAEAADLRCYLS